MAKRKIFIKTDVSRFTHEVSDSPSQGETGASGVRRSLVALSIKPGRGSKNFDFKDFYNIGVDQVTQVCQDQIERFLNNQDEQIERATIAYYCFGLSVFLQYLSVLSAALSRDINLRDINRNVIDSFLSYLRDRELSTSTQKNYYTAVKAVLATLCRRGLIAEVRGGDDATFPRNPFPGVSKKHTGAHPMPKAQRQALSLAVKTEILPLFADDAEPTAYQLSCALLVIALHTGRNTTPLLDMGTDCLCSHPKEDTQFLIVYKRRGHSTSKVALKAAPEPEVTSMPTVRPSVVRLIRRVIDLSNSLREEAPVEVADSIWLYRRQKAEGTADSPGPVTALCNSSLYHSIKRLVAVHNLTGSDGLPIQISVSALRKTFVNRMYEILDGDVVASAAAAGNSPRVAELSYLRPGENSKKNWSFMGSILTQELLTGTLGATERTPMGACSDSKAGEYAPNRDGASCMNFLNCLRCRNYVVTGDDLHRLFSFYWRIYDERSRMPRKRWEAQFAHVARLIDRDVIDAGLAARTFNAAVVAKERERARHDPHPFWRSDTLMASLAEGAL